MQAVATGAFLMLAVGMAHSATLDLSAITSASLVSRKTNAGTHLSRAGVSVRELPAQALPSLLGPVSERLVASKCGAQEGVTVKILPESVRDYVGGTSSTISGIGLYTSLPDATISAIGNWYIAPFVATKVTVSVGGRSAEARVVEHFYRRLDQGDIGSADFLQISTEDLLKSISPFVVKQFESALEPLLGRVCTPT